MENFLPWVVVEKPKWFSLSWVIFELWTLNDKFPEDSQWSYFKGAKVQNK